MNAGAVEIVPIGESDIESAASVVVSAYMEDAEAVATIRKKPEQRLRILRRYFTHQLVLNLPQGASRCALLDGEVVGVMIISAPGRSTSTSREMVKSLWRMLFDLGPLATWRGLKYTSDDERHRPNEQHYYLEIIAVDPKFQKRGIGAALLDHLSKLADKDRALIYLCTSNPNHPPYYEKFGFRTESETRVIEFTHYHMLRDPKGFLGREV